MKKRTLKQLLKISFFINLVLLIPLAIYVSSSVMDEWIIEFSLRRHCKTLQEEFQGDNFSPAYLCTFLDSEQ